MTVIKLDHIVRGGELLHRTKGTIATRSVNMVKAPTRQFVHSDTHCSLWSGYTKKQINSMVAVIHKQESRHKVPKSVLREVLERMQFTLHSTRGTPHGASRLVQAMPAWLVKTRRAPSRHSRDATVYGQTTTAMHKLSTPPSPSSHAGLSTDCLDSMDPSPRRFSLRSLASLSRLATSPPLPKCEAVWRLSLRTAAAAMRDSTPAVSCSLFSLPRRMHRRSSSVVV